MTPDRLPDNTLDRLDDRPDLHDDLADVEFEEDALVVISGSLILVSSLCLSQNSCTGYGRRRFIALTAKRMVMEMIMKEQAR